MRLAVLMLMAAGLVAAQEARVFKTTGQGGLRVHIFKPEGGDSGRPAALFFFGG